MKLWHVTIEHEVYAVGETERDAIENAKDGIRDEFMDGYESASPVSPSQAKWIGKDDLDSIPFGSEDDRTVRELIDEMPAPENPNQGKIAFDGAAAEAAAKKEGNAHV